MILLVVWASIAGLWRPVSLVIAAGWVGVEGWFRLTGSHAPDISRFVIDAALLASIVRWYGCKLDLLIGVAVLPQWWLYAQPMTATVWWSLWWLTAVQLLLAGPWAQVMRAAGSYSHGTLRRSAP